MCIERCEVLIIGAGIIGAACASELSQRGVKVTVIDQGRVGHGCSYGNAGWITPCFAMPLPMPGMMIKSMKWILNPEGPLYVKPQPSMLLAGWMWRFLRAMREEKMLRSVGALTELSKVSLAIYRELDRLSPNTFGFSQQGLLMIAQSDKALKAGETEMNLVARHGIPGRFLSASAVREMEPAVRGGEIAGGFYFPEEAHAEPLAAVKHLMALAIKHGTQVIEYTEALDFGINDGKICSVITTRALVRAEKIVIATGAWSGRHAAQLGLNVPMMSGKGYAVIVPPLEVMPRVPIMVIDRKVAITPREDSLRIAGTMELVDLDESITRRRVDTMIRGADSVLNLPQPLQIKEIWRGLRPCTPDGVPVIGPVAKSSNVFIAAGHQMLGLQTGAGTGRLLADLVCGTTPCVNPEPFRADRFGGSKHRMKFATTDAA
jgi:D-amino-acid dehydrogenase